MPEKVDPKDWPGAHGRFNVGDPKSCVAVCTLMDHDIELPKEKTAISGPCFTENIGIERIIKNIIGNPNIRFIVLCGNEPKGHFVGQALKCIMEKGIAEDRRIIGAIGAMPFLKNIDNSEIDCFKRQITIIDKIGVSDAKEIEKTIDTCITNDPGALTTCTFTEKVVQTHEADYDPEKNWTADDAPDKNWFTISVDRQNNNIIVEHYTGYGGKTELCCKIVGKTAASIAGTIVKKGKISKLYNATYLGKELQKAELALRSGKDYEQEKSME